MTFLVALLVLAHTSFWKIIQIAFIVNIPIQVWILRTSYRRREIMKYLNLLGFIVCIVVVFLPEKFKLLLLVPAIIFIINGSMLIIKGRIDTFDK